MLHTCTQCNVLLTKCKFLIIIIIIIINISLPDLEYVGILFEHLHRSFDTSKQLSGPSNAAGNGRKIARSCGAALLGLVYNAHLLQVLPIQ